MRELRLEDIEGVYEDASGAPTVRIVSLVDGGLYFVRPTEVHATECVADLARTRYTVVGCSFYVVYGRS